MRDEHQLHAAVVELDRARQRDHQVLHDPELVPGRQGRQGRHLQLRHQARQGDDERQDHLDAGGNRLGDHLEVPELYPAGRQLDRRVLLGRDHQQLAAGRHRDEDDPHWQEHAQHHRVQGHLSRTRPEHLPRRGEDRRHARTAPATTRSAIRCSSATSAARTRSRTWKSRTRRPRSSTRRRRRRSARTRSSTVASAASATEDAVNMIVSGFCKEVFRELPMEFAVEARKLLSISLEGSVG